VFRAPITIARKEITEMIRDRRALHSSILYTLMGPLIVGLISFSPTSKQGQHGSADTLLALASVFTLIAAFSGGMQVAMDAFAGERERRSLLPLLTNPVSRFSIAAGKWIAISLFAVCAVLIDLCAFGFIPTRAQPGIFAHLHVSTLLLTTILGLFPLAILAASVELLVSIFCRSLKEAHTYLAFVVFIPMAAGMFMAFFPHSASWWWYAFPVVGQQSALSLAVSHQPLPSWSAVVLSITTAAVAIVCLTCTARILDRDENVYGQ
jgi:sodium transport system permease protein